MIAFARAAAWVAALSSALLPALAGVPLPQPAVDRSTTCVAPAAQMRRDHMDLLKHRRDRTVREGVRGGKTALEACVDCHAAATGGTVAGRPDAFCASCHAYVAVHLDCFECHQPGRGPGPAAGTTPAVAR